MKTFTIEQARSAAALKATHEAAGLKRMLDERISAADAPGTIWHDAEDVFAELETRNAR